MQREDRIFKRKRYHVRFYECFPVEVDIWNYSEFNAENDAIYYYDKILKKDQKYPTNFFRRRIAMKVKRSNDKTILRDRDTVWEKSHKLKSRIVWRH